MDVTKEDQILALLVEMKQELSNVKGQQEENTSILRALEHRVEENGAKIEGISVEMAREFGAVRAEMKIAHESHEERLARIEQSQAENLTKIGNIEEKIDIVSLVQDRIEEHEWEIRKIKQKIS